MERGVFVELRLLVYFLAFSDEDSYNIKLSLGACVPDVYKNKNKSKKEKHLLSNAFLTSTSFLLMMKAVLP